MTVLKAPFPYFGGKSKVSHIVWKAIGSDIDTYVEPFVGSAAVLLARPDLPFKAVETVNDKDGFIANFWRAVAADPDGVAHYADWPVNEHDLEARHYWLVTEGAARLPGILARPDGYDAQIAGWWLWGICAWIGSGWCSGNGPWQATDEGWVKRGDAGRGINRQLPHTGNAGRGINRQLPHTGDAGQGINRKLPHTGDAGQGINRKLPHTGNAGLGINRTLPHTGDAGRGSLRTKYIHDTIGALYERMRDVRVASGDWSRVLGSGIRIGKNVGVFLDPPYAASDRSKTYTYDDCSVSVAARDWAIEYAASQGDRARIVFAGYAGQGDCEVFKAAGWRVFAWKADGGYGKAGARGMANATRERLWMSPGCLSVEDVV